jgi:hypothetical protein
MAGGAPCQCGVSQESLKAAWHDAVDQPLFFNSNDRCKCDHELFLHPSVSTLSQSVSPKTPASVILVLFGACNGGVTGGVCDKGCLHFKAEKAKDEKGNLIVRCSCGHPEYNHELLSSFVTPPAPKPKTPAQESRDKGSFRKQLIARLFDQDTVPMNKKLECHICQILISKTSKGCHIVDLNLVEEFKKKRKELGSANFPISINDPDNGLLLCASCHENFDHKERLIRIKGDGTIVCHADLLVDPVYKKLHGKKVWWAERIGAVHWPSSDYLDWANILPKGSKSKSTKKLKLASGAAAGEEESESESDESEFEKKMQQLDSRKTAAAFLKDAGIDEKDCEVWLNLMFTKQGTKRKRKKAGAGENEFQLAVPAGYRYIGDRPLPAPWYPVLLEPQGSEVWFNPETNRAYTRLRGG